MATDQPGPLAAAAARKHDATITRASAALRELDRTGGVINFQAVARAASVSRQWLYQQPDLRREIEQLRTASATLDPPVPSSQRATEGSLRQRIRSLLDENHRLRGESHELRAELALAYGERRDTRHGA
jgi:Family of unknown function (DUF6262)